jgi:hypothetical protein
MMNDVSAPRSGELPQWLGWPAYRAWQTSRAEAWQAYLEQVEAAYARWAAVWGSAIAPLASAERGIVAQLAAATGLWPPVALGQPPRWAA